VAKVVPQRNAANDDEEHHKRQADEQGNQVVVGDGHCHTATIYSTLENTSGTFTRQASQAGMIAPRIAATPPTVGPHHQAASGISNVGKNAMGKLIPPISRFTTQ